MTNASFVAQTADWAPAHLSATLDAAYRHQGFSFVRILQRCPVWTPKLFLEAAQNPDRTEILVHDQGIRDADLEAVYKTHVPHDPRDLDSARHLAEDADEGAPRALLPQPREPAVRRDPAPARRHTAEEKIEILEPEFDRHAV